MDDRVRSLLSEAERLRKQLNDKEAELEQTKSDLAATEVHSPVDGIIIARKGEQGKEVDRNTKDLFVIATELSDMQVTVEPEPPLLARLAAGQPAIVILSEANNEPLPAQLSEIKGTQVIIDFKSPTTEIKPGLTAQVRLKIK
jgi:multidrug resistance efflux pump